MIDKLYPAAELQSGRL